MKTATRSLARKGIEGLQYDWQRAGGFIPDESHRREVFNIVLSMPGGTPADQVRDAAKAFAKETFEGHKYVFALHDDTDSPHVHLAVRAERMDGYRLNPRKADLQRWRERFAARLAGPRDQRGCHPSIDARHGAGAEATVADSGGGPKPGAQTPPRGQNSKYRETGAKSCNRGLGTCGLCVGGID